jgi:hypothetical protein
MTKTEATTGIADRISRFKHDLGSSSVPLVVQKHITYGNCHILSEDQYFELKARVAERFSLHPSEVLVVGSGKLGFSIAPSKRYRPFSDTSDIDVALVSASLFDRYWMDVFTFKAERNFWPKENAFNAYLVKGWIRPDMLPPAQRFKQAKDWWDFFGQLTKELNTDYKITAGLYRAWPFLESYQSVCVTQCHSALIGNQ